MPKKQSNKLPHYNNFEILRVTVIQKSKPLDHEQANLDALWYLNTIRPLRYFLSLSSLQNSKINQIIQIIITPDVIIIDMALLTKLAPPQPWKRVLILI